MLRQRGAHGGHRERQQVPDRCDNCAWDAAGGVGFARLGRKARRPGQVGAGAGAWMEQQ